MHDAGLVDTVLNLASLRLFDGIRDVKGHGSDFRVRHESARPEDSTEAANGTHHVGRCDAAVEVEHSILNPLDQIIGTRKIRARLQRFLLLLALGKDQDANLFAGAVR
jgi:hypothetical protein